MASPYPITNRYRVTPLDHGQIIKLGNAGRGRVGTWQIHFVPDASWDGQLALVGRIDHPEAQNDQIAYDPVPCRKIYLNTASGDYSMVSDVIVTSTSILQVPASGLSIAFLASCAAGYGFIYSIPLDGPSAV